MAWIAGLLAAFAWMVVCPASLAAQRETVSGRFEVLLRPLLGPGANVASIEVRTELRGSSVPSADRFSVRAPITYASIAGIADAMENLELRDASGVVPLAVENDAANPAGFPYYRHWRAQRAVADPIVLTYRVRVPSTGGGGPQFGVLGHAGGFSAAGSGFLVLPEGVDRDVAVHVSWDLRNLAPGSIAVSNFGHGDFDLQASPDALTQGYYMAGPVGRYPDTGSVDGFSATWLGVPPFDAQQEMAWTGQAYAWLRTFFRDTTREPFRVFVRVLPGVSRYAGTALRNSFMLGTPARDADSASEAPRGTLVHELVHHWALGIEGSQGANTWFAEGLATHYARLLTLRSGLGSVESYGRSLNETARNYYTSPARNLSADSIGRLGFSNEAARRVPYLRGALYFADLDARIRAASGGRRTLDDLLIPLFQRIRNGESVDQNGWVALVVRELGAAAREQFEAVILRGETIVPSSDAFGPCFERRPAVLRSDSGDQVNGFEWFRVASVPDERCLAW
jgi:hypothetical protein